MALNMNLFKAAEFDRIVWSVTAPSGTRPEEMLKPAYWVHVANQLKPFNKIEVRAEDMSFYGELLVTGVGKAHATVQWLGDIIELDSDVSTPETTGEFIIEFRKADRWRVVRRSDREILSAHHETKKDAQVWAIDNERVAA